MASKSRNGSGSSRIRAPLLGLLCTLAAMFVPVLLAPASASALSLEQVGSFERPTYVTSDPADPDRVFVVEQSGRIRITEDGSTTTFLDIRSIVHQHQGLWSMAFSPSYANDGRFYVVYAGVDDPRTAGVDESGYFHLDQLSSSGQTADPGSRREVLTIEYRLAPVTLQGGQLNFGPDGSLYASTGVGPTQGAVGDPDGHAQNTHNLLGKIMRIDPSGSRPGEYTVPADNPFTGAAGCTDGCDEIWSYGLRNPWRFSFDRLTGDLVIGDVGEHAWEEVDYEPASVGLGRGDNFGWNCREGAHDYPGPGEPAPVCADRVGTFTEPVFEYPHVESGPCSIIGGYVVRDRALDDLFGRYLYADFCVGELRSLNLGLPIASGDRSEGLSVPNVTSFGEDADCRIYVASMDGPVYRLAEPGGGGAAGCPPPLDPGPGPGPGPGAAPLTLDLEAKKQKLKKKLKVFATASLASTLGAEGKKIKDTTKQLAANQETKVKAKLKRKARNRLEEKLEEKGKAKVKVTGAATTQSGAEATDKVKVKLKD